MCTTKDFRRAAAIVRAHVEAMDALDFHEETIAQTREALAGAFVAFFRGENPRFNADTFRAACGCP